MSSLQRATPVGRVHRPHPEAFGHFLNIRRFLWDEGPHTTDDIATAIGLGKARTAELLSLMIMEGTVEKFRRKLTTYFKLEDSVIVDHD